jgi:adenylate kinase
MNAIILLGGPGAGKGTLAESLTSRTDCIHVSTGDMLRAAIRSGSDLGREAKSFMDQGELVPDSLILRMIEARINTESSEARFMFDGFPRTIEQAEGLDALFVRKNGFLTHVFNLIVPREQLLQRLTGRRVCRNCGAVFHVLNMPPEKEGVCDKCGGELYQRKDDSEQTILNRLSVYEKQTAPLISFYEQKGLLRNIEADRSPEECADRVLSILDA